MDDRPGGPRAAVPPTGPHPADALPAEASSAEASPAAASPAEEPPAEARGVAGRTQPVLPSVTSDEIAVGWGDWPEEPDEDERFLREVPPHHGTY